MPKKGYSQTKEHKNNIRKTRIGQKHSKKTKIKMSKTHADVSGKNNPMYGRKQKQSSKDKIRIALTGSIQTLAHKLKRTGRNNSKWKGDKFKNVKRRWEIWIDEKRVSQSRYVAEQCLKRKLTSLEVVHHINGDCSDDRPENLYIFSNQSKHMQYHGWKFKTLLISNLLLII